MKLSTLKQTPFEVLARIATWLIVGSVSVYAMVVNGESVAWIGFVVALFCLFILSFTRQLYPNIGYHLVGSVAHCD
jgi:hypothetical protein